MRWRRHIETERDLERELRAHLELETEERQASGLSAREARFAALRAFGNLTLIRDEVRNLRPWTCWELFLRDLLHALRALRKTPGFTFLAILTLALGIGANTAIFSVLDTVLLRPLPYPHAGRLVRIQQNQPKLGETGLGTAPPEFASYRDRTRAFSGLAGYQSEAYDRTGDGDPEYLVVCRATASLFATLQVAPMLGRVFTTEEERPGAGRAAVLSYSYWQRRYSGDKGVVGRTIRLNERPYRIIGVMPPGFSFPSTPATPSEPPALWMPLFFTSAQLGEWSSSYDTRVVARLRRGVSLEQARHDAERVAQEFQRQHRDIYSGNNRLQAETEAWQPWDRDEHLSAALVLLAVAVALILLIACANVANLLLARAGARQRELSVRRALGAGPLRLIGQVFAETSILAFSGGAAGCLAAQGLLRIMAVLWNSELNLRTAHLDARVLAFAIGLSVLTCLICGAASAWAASRPDASEALKQTARQIGPGRHHRRMARLFIVAEIAGSLVLLIGTSLLLRSFVHVLQTPLGFDPEHALLVRTAFNRQRYAIPERRHQAERTIVARLSSLPGVDAVGLTTHVPLADERGIGFVVEGQETRGFHWADNALVSADYFRVMGIPLLEGRSFSDNDTPQAPPVALINRSMAARYWPNQSAVGKRFQWAGRWITVIGVTGDIHVQPLDEPIGPMIYNFVYQMESGASPSAVFVIRTHGADPLLLAAAAQKVIWSVDHGLPILRFSTLREVVSASLAVRRASLVLAAGFALLAVLLSLIGVYGVLSYSMSQRIPELGLRLALGATRGEVIRLVLGEGIHLAAWGIPLGVGGALAVEHLFSSLLFAVRPFDPVSFGAAVMITTAASLSASYLPARRAAGVDPLVALRYDE